MRGRWRGAARRLPGPLSPAWVLAETVSAALVSLLGLLFVARIVGPEQAGIAAVAASAFLLLDVPLSALFGDALLQRRDLAARHRDSALWATLGAGLAGGLLLVALAGPIARVTAMPAVAHQIMVLALLLPFSALSGLLSALALKARRYRLLALRVLLCQPVAIGMGIAAALAGWGAWAMVAQQAVATGAILLLLVLRSFWRPALRLDRRALAELWPVAGPQILAILVQHGRYRVFVLGLGMLVVEAVVAVTNIAFRLFEVAMNVVTGAALRLAMPRLAALQHDRTRLAEAYGDLAQLQALCGVPVALGLAIAAPRLMEVLMGGPWVAAAAPAQLVALAAIPGFLTGPGSSLWVAIGRTRVNLLLQLVAFGVPLAALAVVRPVDAAGAALCWIGGTLAVPVVELALVLRVLHRSPLWLLQRLGAALLGGLALAVAALSVARAVAGWAPMPALAVTAVAGALAYGAVVLLALRGQPPRALQDA